MRSMLAVLAVLSSTAVALAADPVFPKNGAAGLVPPPGMTESTQFAGFEDRPRQASIVVAEMPAAAFAQIEPAFTDAALAAKGITVAGRETTTVGGARALLVTGSQRAGAVAVRKWILIVGAEAATVMVTAQVPDGAAEAYPDAAIRRALMSLALRPPRSLAEQVAALPFTIAETGGFRVAKVLAGATVVLTEDPGDAGRPGDVPMFVVAAGTTAPAEAARDAFARRAIASLPDLTGLDVARAQTIDLGGEPGHEIVAGAKRTGSGAAITVVQWIRFRPDGYVRMIGLVRSDRFEAMLPQLQLLRDSVAPR